MGVFLFYTFLDYNVPWHVEFDAVKSESNLAKHGIDSFHAQLLWEDDSRRARTSEEVLYEGP